MPQTAVTVIRTVRSLFGGPAFPPLPMLFSTVWFTALTPSPPT
jgi:hypothetical protein